MLGFYIPEKNIFVPCESKEQYFYLKVRRIVYPEKNNGEEGKGETASEWILLREQTKTL